MDNNSKGDGKAHARMQPSLAELQVQVMQQHTCQGAKHRRPGAWLTLTCSSDFTPSRRLHCWTPSGSMRSKGCDCGPILCLKAVTLRHLATALL